MDTSLGGVRVRPASADDEALLLAWRNDSETRWASRSTALVGASEHEAWFRESLGNPSRMILICEDQSARPFATVRFDATTTAGSTECEVSISVEPNARGSGRGPVALRACERYALDAMTIRRFKAYIRRDNLKSLRLFEGCGYLLAAEGDSEGVWLIRDIEG